MTLVSPSRRNGLAYDQPIIGGRKWPGVCRVEGCDRTIDVQKKKAQGSDGAKIEIGGEDLAEPKLTFVLWDGWDDLNASRVNYFTVWEDYRTVFEFTVDPKDPKAITFEHPKAAHAGITAFVLKKIGDPKILPEGIVEITVETVQYKKPTSRGGSGSSPDAATEANKPPRKGNPWWDRAEAELAVSGQLTKEFATAWSQP